MPNKWLLSEWVDGQEPPSPAWSSSGAGSPGLAAENGAVFPRAHLSEASHTMKGQVTGLGQGAAGAL